MADEPPTGEMFSRVYISHQEPLNDSPRFRERLLANYQQLIAVVGRREPFTFKFAQIVEREIGVSFPSGYRSYDTGTFFRDAEIKDVLSAITLIYELLSTANRHFETYASRFQSLANPWKNRVARIMQEEGVKYRLDDACGVHPLYDDEFERNRASAIKALSGTNTQSVLDAFQTATDALDTDCKAAIRSAYEAVETLAKLLSPKSFNTINDKVITKYIRPIVDVQLADDDVARSAANKFLTGLADWISAAHPYRHGQDQEEPAQPPLDFTVAMIGTAASYLRWLAGFLDDGD
jgi:hypothetical protein